MNIESKRLRREPDEVIAQRSEVILRRRYPSSVARVFSYRYTYSDNAANGMQTISPPKRII